MCTVAQSMFVTGASSLMDEMKTKEKRVARGSGVQYKANGNQQITITVAGGKAVIQGAQSTPTASKASTSKRVSAASRTKAAKPIPVTNQGISITVAGGKGKRKRTFKV